MCRNPRADFNADETNVVVPVEDLFEGNHVQEAQQHEVNMSFPNEFAGIVVPVMWVTNLIGRLLSVHVHKQQPLLFIF